MTRIFPFLFVLLSVSGFGQQKGRLPNKTLKDSVFEIGDIIKLPKLIFDLSYPINPTTVDSLAPVANFLKKYPSLKVEIDCHTDLRGGTDANIGLSNFRAEHVREVLVKRFGIDPQRVTYKGYGDTAPLISEKEILKSKAKTRDELEELYAINRRTELLVIDTK